MAAKTSHPLKAFVTLWSATYDRGGPELLSSWNETEMGEN